MKFPNRSNWSTATVFDAENKAGKLANSGTSAGLKKAWETRNHKTGWRPFENHSQHAHESGSMADRISHDLERGGVEEYRRRSGEEDPHQYAADAHKTAADNFQSLHDATGKTDTYYKHKADAHKKLAAYHADEAGY